MEPLVSDQPQQKLESLSNKLGFDIPVEAVPLPSRGVLYPPEHPLHNAETVEIKCMTAKEEDILTSSALLKKGTVFDALMQSCFINKSIDPSTLLPGDRNAILVAIRITGYGPEHTVKITCPECEDVFEHTFNMTSLKIKRMGVAPDHENTNLFSYTLPLSKLVVKFKLLNGKDIDDMNEYSEKRKKLGMASDSNVTSRLFFSVVEIKFPEDGHNEKDRGKISQIVSNLRAGDARALRLYMDKVAPDLDKKSEVRCSKCSKVSEVDVP